ILRALVAWYSEVAANRASATIKSQLRGALIDRLARTAPEADGTGANTGTLVSLATHGIDALDGYFALYLPQLVLALTVPLAVLMSVLRADWVSGLIILVTLPLIPVFMALIGTATRSRTERQVAVLQRLSHHFLDVVAGLPTLKVFGRSKT